MIRYVTRDQIDVARWDHCIDNAPNGLIYAHSLYLDYMAKHWDALIWDDYQAVMPLTWNRKYGLHYLYQPAFTASLGIFGDPQLCEKVEQFIEAIPGHFKLIEISLNHGNPLSNQYTTQRSNYVLDMMRDYNDLFDNYRDNIKRNIRKCQKQGCTCKRDIPIEDIIYLASGHLRAKSNIKSDDYENFRRLYEALQLRGKAVTYGVFTSAGQLVSSCAYFFSHQRAYYILVGNHPNGKTLGASHFLIDRFIYDWAGRNLWLDFEGSDIRNLAFFYNSFGATPEIYPFIRINRLPAWLSWVKK